jgi:hypothetical protein
MVSLPTAELSPAAGTQSKAGRRASPPLSPTTAARVVACLHQLLIRGRLHLPQHPYMTMSAGTGKATKKKSKVQVKMEAVNKRPPNFTAEDADRMC